METSAYNTAKQIASMMVALPRVDALIFTAGVGENAAGMRARIIDHLAVFGYKIDKDQNKRIRGRDGLDGVISIKDTPVTMAIRTNEELVIAEETEAVVNGTYTDDAEINTTVTTPETTEPYDWD